jgi:hypothetical protein
MKMIITALCILISVKTFALTNSLPAISPEWINVMQIRSEAPDSKGETTPGYCNATLIHKNVLITAAHCVKLAYISGMKIITIEAGQYKYITRKSDGQTVRIGYVPKFKLTKNVHLEIAKSLADKIARSGENATIDPTEDSALIWWNEETPEFNDIGVADIVTPTEHNNIIKQISATTFNIVTLNPFADMSIDTKRTAALNNFKWNGYVYSKSLSRVEEGDSGAPLFAVINGKYKIFAVVKGKASTIFDNWDAYSAINPHFCELVRSMPSFIQFETCKL